MLETQHLSNIGILLTYDEIEIITELKKEKVEFFIPNQCSFMSTIKCWPQKFSNRHKNAKSTGLLEIQKERCENKWSSIMFNMRGTDLASKEFRLNRTKRDAFTNAALTTLEGVVAQSPLAAILQPFATTTFESLIDLFSTHGPLFRDDDSDLNVNLNYTTFENEKANEWCLLVKNDLNHENFGSDLAIQAFSQMEESLQNIKKINLQPNSREERVFGATCAETLTEQECVTLIENKAFETTNEKLIGDKLGNYIFSFDLIFPKKHELAHQMKVENLGFYSNEKFYKIGVQNKNFIKWQTDVYSTPYNNVFGKTEKFYTTNLMEMNQCATGLSVNDASGCDYAKITEPTTPQFIKNDKDVVMYLIPKHKKCEICLNDSCQSVKNRGIIFNQLEKGEFKCENYKLLLQNVVQIRPHPLSLPAILPQILSSDAAPSNPLYTVSDGINAVILLIILIVASAGRLLFTHLRQRNVALGTVQGRTTNDAELDGFMRTSRDNESLNEVLSPNQTTTTN